MSTRISCCYQCEDRHMACHDSCEKYLNEKSEYLAEQEIIKKSKTDEYQIRSFKLDAMKRNLRNRK